MGVVYRDPQGSSTAPEDTWGNNRFIGCKAYGNYSYGIEPSHYTSFGLIPSDCHRHARIRNSLLDIPVDKDGNRLDRESA